MYTSVIKINGHGILPPLLNEERRQEMRRERKRAVEKEKLRRRKNNCLLDNIQNVIKKCSEEVPVEVQECIDPKKLRPMEHAECGIAENIPASALNPVNAKSAEFSISSNNGAESAWSSFTRDIESDISSKQQATPTSSTFLDIVRNSVDTENLKGNVEGEDVSGVLHRIRMMDVTVGMLEEDDTDVSIYSNLASCLETESNERGSNMSSIMGSIKKVVRKSLEIGERQVESGNMVVAITHDNTLSPSEGENGGESEQERSKRLDNNVSSDISNSAYTQCIVSKTTQRKEADEDAAGSYGPKKNLAETSELVEDKDRNKVAIFSSNAQELISTCISESLVSTAKECAREKSEPLYECCDHLVSTTHNQDSKPEEIGADVSNADISEVSECVTASVDLKPFMHRDSSMDEDSTLVETTPFPCASPLPGLFVGTSSGSPFQTNLFEESNTPALEATPVPEMTTVKLAGALEFPTSVFLENSSETSTQSPNEGGSSLASTQDRSNTSPNKINAIKEEVAGFPLIRSLSYTLDNPSPILLEYMKRSGLGEASKSGAMKTKLENPIFENKLDVNCRVTDGTERARRPCDKGSQTRSDLSHTVISPSKTSKGRNSPAKEYTRLASKNDLKVDSPKVNLTPKSKRIRDLKNHLFQQYETEWYQMMEEQKKEQERLQQHFESQRKVLINQIKEESPVEPSPDLLNKVLKGMGEEKIMSEGKKRKCAKQIEFTSNEDHAKVGNDFAYKVSIARKQRTFKPDVCAQQSRSPSSSPRKSRGVSPYMCVERSFLGGRSPVMKGIVVGKSPHHPSVHGNFTIPQQALLPENQKKFEKLSAAVKGHLTRRLFRTERVRAIIDTIRDTAIVAHNFLIEAKTRATKQDIEFNKRVCAQLKSALLSLHEVFISLTPIEQMAIINQDRIMKVVSRPPPQARPLSAATIKALERRRKKESVSARSESVLSEVTPVSSRIGRPASSASSSKNVVRKVAIVSSERPKSAPSSTRSRARGRRSMPCRNDALTSPNRLRGDRTYVVKAGAR